MNHYAQAYERCTFDNVRQCVHALKAGHMPTQLHKLGFTWREIAVAQCCKRFS